MYKFMCDLCGKELEHHGERYIVRVEQVPSSYSSKNKTWDLCPECAEGLKRKMDERGEGQVMSVEILRHPTEDDWNRCKMLAMNTIGKQWSGEVSDDWKRKILKAEHSPIRTLMFTIRMEVPYWVSVHFCRHKFGVEHYVSSQRNDRQDKYDRNEAPQGAFVTHVMDVNAQELIQMARMRLCGQASPETRGVMAQICIEVTKTNPEMWEFLVPKCAAHGGCNEFRPCGYYKFITEMEAENGQD